MTLEPPSYVQKSLGTSRLAWIPLVGADEMWHAVRKQAESASTPAEEGSLVSAANRQMMCLRLTCDWYHLMSTSKKLFSHIDMFGTWNIKLCYYFVKKDWLKMTVFWDGAPCSLVEIFRRFRGAYYLHYYLKIQFVIKRKQNASPLQSSD
jgi:hypothetical protein